MTKAQVLAELDILVQNFSKEVVLLDPRLEVLTHEAKYLGRRGFVTALLRLGSPFQAADQQEIADAVSKARESIHTAAQQQRRSLAP